MEITDLGWLFVNSGDISIYCVTGGDRAVVVEFGLRFTFLTTLMAPKAIRNGIFTFILSDFLSRRGRTVWGLLAASGGGSAKVVLDLLLNHDFLCDGRLHLVRSDNKVLLLKITNVGWETFLFKLMRSLHFTRHIRTARPIMFRQRFKMFQWARFV